MSAGEHADPTTKLLEAMVGAPDSRFVIASSRLDGGGKDRSRAVLANEGPPAGWSPVPLEEVGSPEKWRDRLSGSVCTLVNLIHPREIARETLDAVVPAVMSAIHPNGHAAFLLGTNHLSFNRFSGFREALAGYGVEWIVWGGGGPDDVVSWLIVVASPAKRQGARVRIVQAIGLSLDTLLERIRACAMRKGGEADDTVVRPRPIGRDEDWTWEQLSGRRNKLLDDTSVIGVLQPLRSVIVEVTGGRAFRDFAGHIRELDDDSLLPADHARIFGGRDIQRDGTLSAASRCVAVDKVEPRNLLTVGDVLISQVSRLPLRIALVDESHLPAIAGPTVLRLRFQDHVPDERRRLSLAYMRSLRFGQSVAERASMLHDAVRVTGSALQEAKIPAFEDSFVEAMRVLESAEAQFDKWATSVAAAREEFFSAASFERALPQFLERSRVVHDQVAAAADADTLEGRIRQRFPHPFAYRFESVLQLDHGAERVKETVACAEHLVLFLAFLGLANLGAGATDTLRAWTTEDGRLTLDWGKADSLLRQAASKTAKLSDPLAAAVPELGSLHGPLSDPKSELSIACAEMRLWRNDDAHLARCPPDEILAASERFARHLRVLFSAASMLTQTPLVEVETVERDQISDESRARFGYVVGVSSVFARRWEVAKAVLPGDVGLRDVHGRFHRLDPWLLRKTCEKCKRAETFILSKFETKSATYIAMETGHKLVDPKLDEKFESFVARHRGA